LPDASVKNAPKEEMREFWKEAGALNLVTLLKMGYITPEQVPNIKA